MVRPVQDSGGGRSWKFTKEKGIDMVTINPAVVIGPLLQPTVNLSSDVVFKMFGAKPFPNMTMGWVHVRDVAKAHIQAFEVPTANGRYCLVESVAHFSEIVGMLRELYPDAKLPDKFLDDQPFKPTYQVFKVKTESLGINYIPLKESQGDTVDSLTEKGLLNF